MAEKDLLPLPQVKMLLIEQHVLDTNAGKQ
jgi:hypothetical protein